MNHAKRLVLALALATTAVSSVSVPSHAATRAAIPPASRVSAPTQESWIGVVSRVMCRRGAGPYTAGFCLIALVDAIIS